MLQYHQATFLPNNRFVLEACQQFFSNTILGQYYTQTQIDTKDCRIKTIEATMVNKALLLRRLAATGFTKNNLDWNLQYFCYPINERLLTDHLYACQWYSENIDKFIRCNQKTILDNWQISFKDNSDIHPAIVSCVPWNIVVASSALIAIDSIDEQFLQHHPSSIDDGFVEALLAPLLPRQRTLNFTVDELTSNDLKNLSEVCTCFTNGNLLIFFQGALGKVTASDS